MSIWLSRFLRKMAQENYLNCLGALPDFKEEEIISMVKKALDKVMVHYYESFPHDIFYQTNGHPCLTQKLCSWILESLMLEKRDYIREDDLTGHINKLIDSADITLRTTLERSARMKIWI